jgi:hypothetical protein
MTLTELGDFIRANPCAWKDLNEAQRVVATQALLPQAGFDDSQRHLLRRWWLLATPEQIAGMNAILPDKTKITPIFYNNVNYVCGDLLTDALNNGDTYGSVLSILEQLVAYYIDPPPEFPHDATP